MAHGRASPRGAAAAGFTGIAAPAAVRHERHRTPLGLRAVEFDARAAVRSTPRRQETLCRERRLRRRVL